MKPLLIALLLAAVSSPATAEDPWYPWPTERLYPVIVAGSAVGVFDLCEANESSQLGYERAAAVGVLVLRARPEKGEFNALRVLLRPSKRAEVIDGTTIAVPCDKLSAVRAAVAKLRACRAGLCDPLQTSRKD